MTLSTRFKKLAFGLVFAAETTMATTLTLAHHEEGHSEHLPRRNVPSLMEARREGRLEEDHYEWPLYHHEQNALQH